MAYPIVVESDSAEIVKLVRREVEDLSQLMWLVEEIKKLQSAMGVISINKIERERKGCAHRLARRAWILQESCYWDESISGWLEKLA